MKSKEKWQIVMGEQRLYKTLLQYALKVLFEPEPKQIQRLTREFMKDIIDSDIDTFQIDYIENGNPRFLPAERENHRNRREQKKNHSRLMLLCGDCDQPFFDNEEDYYQIEMHGRCVKCKKNQDEIDEEQRLKRNQERWEAIQGFKIEGGKR